MKPILAFLLCVLLVSVVFIAESQIVSFNESSTLLNKPNGKPAFQVNAGVEFKVLNEGKKDSWQTVSLRCFALKTDVEDSVIYAGSVLFDFNGDSVGVVLLTSFCNTGRFIWDKIYPDSLKTIDISLIGYIKAENLNGQTFIRELQENYLEFQDSCYSRIFEYRNTIGEIRTVSENCSLFEIQFFCKGKSETVLVRKKTITTTPLEHDEDGCSMLTEIYRGYKNEQPEKFIISNQAYSCDFKYNSFVFSEQNWLRQDYNGFENHLQLPDKKALYSSTSLQKIFDFQGNCLEFTTKNNNFSGFIGFNMQYEGKDDLVGILMISDEENVLIEKKLLCHDRIILTDIVFEEPRLEFSSNNLVISRDGSVLQLENLDRESRIKKCITGFIVILRFDNYGEDISITLEFRDGDIFLVKNYQDAFELR